MDRKHSKLVKNALNEKGLANRLNKELTQFNLEGIFIQQIEFGSKQGNERKNKLIAHFNTILSEFKLDGLFVNSVRLETLPRRALTCEPGYEGGWVRLPGGGFEWRCVPERPSR